jgi:MFS family permease
MAEVGVLYSALLFAYAVMQFPSGYLSDRFSRRIVITAGAVVFGLGSLFVFVSAPYWSLLVGMGLIGLGTGTHKTVAITMLSRLYPSKTGLSVGVMDTVGQAGGALAPATVVLVLAIAIDWRAIFLAGFVVCLALAYGFHRSAVDETADTERPASADADTDADDDTARSSRAYLRLFRYYHFSAFVAVSSIFAFAWVGLTSFYPLYLSNVASFSAGTAGALYSFLFVLAVSQPLAGDLSDRFDATTIVLLVFGLPGAIWPYEIARFGEQWDAQQGGTATEGDMSRTLALEILGLDEGATREDIIEAHRRLIQKLHPDRGGNDYLASQINLAKSVLLDE